MLLNIVLILYSVFCLIFCLFLRARNEKALCHSLVEGRQFRQASKSRANTGESGLPGNSDSGFGGDSGDAGCGAGGDAGGGCGGGGD
ncbi:hypothetical protein DL738_11690 [Escherichia coli]|nr:hypothetical protein [Escherichia coli]